MSDTPAPYTAPACWCRNCDNAAKSGLSPLAALRLGSRFIVCPDCGNKRCPKGTNHELACTNSNESGQKGSEWESIKPWPKSAETTPAEAPAPALLSAERLAEIQADDVQLQADYHRFSPWQQPVEEDRRNLLAHVAAMRLYTEAAEARAAAAEAQVAGLKEELAELADPLFELKRFVENMESNYDHDSDAHRYGTPCAKCWAHAILEGAPQPYAQKYD